MREKEKNCAEWQEGDRKDVEQFFVAIKNQFHIVRYPYNLWDKKAISTIKEAGFEVKDASPQNSIVN